MSLVLGLLVSLALSFTVMAWGWNQYGTRGRAEAGGAELQAQLQEQEKALESLRDDCDKCAGQLVQAQAQVRGLEGRVSEVTTALDLAEAHLKSQAADLEAERRKNEGLSAALKAKAAEAVPAGLEIAKAADKSEASDELKKAKEEAAAAKRAAQQAQQTLSAAQEQVKAKDAEIARLRVAVQKASADLAQVRAENARLDKELGTLQAEVARLRKRVPKR
jgi:colicin import membrane protein